MREIDIYRLDAHSLRVFVTVFELNSVSRAAGSLNLNQSTVSHTLDKLRSALSDQLFVRAGRGITPTEKAISIMPRIQRIVAEFEGLEAPEEFDPTLETRPLRIAISTPALIEDMRALRAELRFVAPRSSLHIRRLAPRSEVKAMLTEGEVDLAIAVAGLQYSPALNSCRYGHDELVIFFDPTVRPPITSIEQYFDASHAAVDFGGHAKSVVETAFEERGFKRSYSLLAPTTSMLGDLMVGTELVATMPKRLREAAFAGLDFCPTPFTLPKLQYELVWHRRLDHSGRNVWFRRLLLKVSARLHKR
ncbi:LysR family transcriptional regulator [Gymnodinialimonas hymeniacidonis]|uniref:LysR family transcriptional regulator n=1 Tax=Gymnodinialimonas hymeniacidonis TaxID=3126508 RepID=UPI0034C66C29